MLYSINGISQINLHEWSDIHYNDYNSNEFQKLEIIHSKIDIRNIDYKLFNAAIFYATNLQRKKYGKKEFIHNVLLEKSAYIHSQDMVKHNFFSHTSPINGKEKMTDRYRYVGINKYGSAAENICYNYQVSPTYWSFAVELVNGWMDSPGHRKNILNSQYIYLGCGVYYYKFEYDKYIYVKSTQNFSSNVN